MRATASWVMPRFSRLACLPPLGDGTAELPAVRNADYVTAVTEAITALDRSYLAVQGPPGSGKTYVGSHVVAALVARGWKVGVVAQSHKVIENMLGAIAHQTGNLPAAQSAFKAALAANPLAPKPPHFPAKAKHVIFLYMNGAMTHLDTFDLKPGRETQGDTKGISTSVIPGTCARVSTVFTIASASPSAGRSLMKLRSILSLSAGRRER